MIYIKIIGHCKTMENGVCFIDRNSCAVERIDVAHRHFHIIEPFNIYTNY